MTRTLLDKIWDSHRVTASHEGEDLLYIDLHLLHEVTSPQAFEGLWAEERTVRRPDRTVATVDHSIPTRGRHLPIADPLARAQVETLRKNVDRAGVEFFDLHSPHQGIVHVVAPELGLTRPGSTIVCGDSHTATHGAFGALAFGIGTSQVEHVLATQCLRIRQPESMEIHIEGTLGSGVSAKDLILHVIRRLGVHAGRGAVIEYHGEAIRSLSIEERMTICNMSIELGARAGLIAADEVTVDYLRGRPRAPSGGVFEEAAATWRTFHTDEGAIFDRSVRIDATEVRPMATWGTTPAMAAPVTGRVPEWNDYKHEGEEVSYRRALDYMGLKAGTPLRELSIDRVFIGSCTNGRLHDLRMAAGILRGRRISRDVEVLVVPGSSSVRAAAEGEGLHQVFLDAGAEWREAGCSMCLGMNDDVLRQGERCASTSNRNFEGRQGMGGRTHLVSPAVAAASAVLGRLGEPSELGVAEEAR